jgi:predicted RNA-binding protein
MAKAETVAPVVELRERLPIKSVHATADYVGHKTKTVIIEMEESGLTLQDIMDDPKLFRGIQANRGTALQEDDKVELRWLNMRVYAVVDFADNQEVRLLKPDVKHRGERVREPWQDDNFIVRACAGGWSYFRKKDGVKMTPATYPTWEAAKAAVMREQYAARL